MNKFRCCLMAISPYCHSPGWLHSRCRRSTLSTHQISQEMTLRRYMSGMLTGNIELTEEQFSSLLSELLKTNSGPNFPISEIQAWFEPNDEIFLRAVLKPNVLLSGDTLDLKGTVGVMDNHVTLNLQQAGMGSLSVGEPMMSMISQQINSVLAGPQFGVAASVKTDTGKLMVQIGQ